uniref:legumain n=2 Tax=Tetraselmis sp. GSL018 TaxID=582737 RepID=A0A061QGT2_9CHLO
MKLSISGNPYPITLNLSLVLVCVVLRTVCCRYSIAEQGQPYLTISRDESGTASTNHSRVHWALLVAGSAGWGNYRHQADICHAYQVLKEGGLSDENIIVMMADDLAANPSNPHPGELYNRPGGPDVYDGIKKDYVGRDVTAENLLKVLAGDAEAMQGVGSGKVIASGRNDTVFFYFADHGAPGILGMPYGSFLYADQLVGTMANRSRADGFGKMVVYIEACESGSVFQGMNLTRSRIYATTAANAVESSWGTYCPGMEPSAPSEFNTCLGDLYSVAFLEDTEASNHRGETLQDQYEAVKERASNHGSYAMGSHVLQWGDLSFTSDLVGEYMGFGLGQKPVRRSELLEQAEPAAVLGGSVRQRDAELLYMTLRYMREPDPELQAQYFAELEALTAERARIDAAAREATARLLSDPHVVAVAMARLPEVTSSEILAGPAGGIRQRLQGALLHTTMGRPDSLQVVDDWECLREAVAAWESCRPLGQYGMKYARLFANVCNLGLGDVFKTQLFGECI